MKAALILFSFLGVVSICSALEPAYMYIQPYASQDLRIRHENFRGKLEKLSTDVDNNEGAWKIVPGLANCKNILNARNEINENCISFEAVNKPGHYLKRRDLEIWLDKFNNTDTYKKDATFWIVRGFANVADASWVTFESLSLPGYYIKHENLLLYLRQFSWTESPTFYDDVTFRMTQSMSSQVSTFIRPWDSLPYRLRHQASRGKLQKLSTDLDKQEGSWKMVPGLSNSTYISFESANKPGYYLRSRGKGEELWLDKDDGTDQFKKDATFKIVPGLRDTASISFESVDRPGWFIKHWCFDFWVQKNDLTDVFANVATFRKTSFMKETDGTVAFLADD